MVAKINKINEILQIRKTPPPKCLSFIVHSREQKSHLIFPSTSESVKRKHSRAQNRRKIRTRSKIVGTNANFFARRDKKKREHFIKSRHWSNNAQWKG